MFDERYLEYVELFNERCFYDCHEVLEDLWLDNNGPSRRFYQGLIHFATAFQHLLRRNMAGFESRLNSTQDYLAPYQDHYEGLNVVAIRQAIACWKERLARRSEGEILPFDDAAIPILKLEQSP